MKLNGNLRVVVVAVCICGLAATSGCKWFRRTPPKSGEQVETPLSVENPPMGERTAEGELVKDLNLQNVQFAYDSFQITDSEVSKIKAVADYLQANPNTYVVNEGHCDERGTAEYNISLGENRAQAVRAYLIGLKVDGSRIQTKSFGKDKPLIEGHNEAAWSKNRRVEFMVYK